MKEREPVALWKGIVGTALSGTVILVLAPIDFAITSMKDVPLWIIVTLFTCTVVCFFSLILSLMNLISAANYRKSHVEEEERFVPEQKKNDDNTELLHKLLAEGKITIEEYDKLRNK